MVLTALLGCVLLGSSPWTARLKDGAQVELIAVTDPHENRSWSPDGKHLPKAVYAGGLAFWGKQMPSPKPDVDAPKGRRVFVVRVSGVRVGREVDGLFQVGSSDVRFSDTDLLGRDMRTWYVSATFDLGSPPTTGDLQVGIADGPFRVAGWYRKGERRVHGVPFHASDMPPRGMRTDTTTVGFVRPSSLRSASVRVVALARNHRLLDPSGSVALNEKPDRTVFFFVGKPSDVDRVELHTRPFEKIVFGNVALQPNPGG